MLAASGGRAAAAGNIGTAPDRRWPTPTSTSSSPRCRRSSCNAPTAGTPTVSCWLNLAPTIWTGTPTSTTTPRPRPGSGPTRVRATRSWSTPTTGRGRTSRRGRPGGAAGHLLHHRRRRLPPRRRRPGGAPGLVLARCRTDLVRALPHDLANALAALAVARAAGASAEGCIAALRGARPLPHRVELVAEDRGVRWYDDSKATTPASVLAAVAGFGSVVLIAGGRNKGLDLACSSPACHRCTTAVAIGDAADEVAAAFGGRGRGRAGPPPWPKRWPPPPPWPGPATPSCCHPGCASFDWYRSYAAARRRLRRARSAPTSPPHPDSRPRSHSVR